MGAVECFASANLHSVNSQNQFHFAPAGRRAGNAQKLSPASQVGANRHLNHLSAPATPVNHMNTGSSQGRMPHRYSSNPAVGKIGFISATQIPIGGGDTWNSTALAGDFNGDGKKDIVSIVENYVSSTWTYSVSVVLSNGDGTFKPAVLTPVAGNDSNAQIVVGDLNGDGKDDIIVAHQNGNGGYTSSSFDVLISNGDGNFTSGSIVSITSNQLAGGALADVNADGKLDAVIVDQNSPANVWTLLGNGDGTFQAPTSVALSGQVGNNVILADLNGDGLLDVVDDDYNTGQVTTYLATSASAYASAVSYATPDDVYDACSTSAGDLNGDGKPEIVSANCSDDNIAVYVNNGDGTFQTAVYYYSALHATGGYAANVYPLAVSIADVNGDGKADIISSNRWGGDVTILLGNGDGTVQVPTIGYATGGYPHSPAIVADFNGDGLVDMLVPDGEFSYSYLKGYGDGSFRSALNYYSPISNNGHAYGIGLATADLNGDGIPDFVLGNCCDSGYVGLTVFLSRSDGSMQPGVNYGTGNLYYVAIADFDGDGKLDLATADESTGLVEIFNGVGDGTFVQSANTFATDTTATGPEGLVAGDFDKDGYPDLAVQNAWGQNIAILINDRTGNFLAPVTYPVSSNNNYQGIATADLNKDGNLDLVVPLEYGSAVALFLGNGDGTFTAQPDLATTGQYPQAVAIADLNGDGNLDLAITTDQWSSPGVEVALGNGDGTFQAPAVYSSSLQDINYDSPYPEFIQAVDIDGDGKLDLVYTNSEYGTVGVLFGAGDGTFPYDPVEYPSGGYAYGLVVADVNQDGAPDVVTAGDDFSGITVLLNQNGSGAAANYTISAAPSSATVIAGSSASFTLTVTPLNHYNGTVTFSCGSLPALAQCTFTPASVTLTGGTPVTVQMKITTTGLHSSMQAPADVNPHGNSPFMLASLSTIGLFGMILAGGFKKRGRWQGAVLGVLILVSTLSFVGCGSSGSSKAITPAGSYTVTVKATGTAGTTNGNTTPHPFNVTITVK
jgi:hypothetical protein